MIKSILTPSLIKTAIRVGLGTTMLIVLHEISNLFLIYRYFKFEYYIAGAVIIALFTGVILTRNYHKREMAVNSDHNLLDELTAKELQVLELISDGKSNKEIASLNYIEMSTVKTHINNIFFKLGVKNRKDAVKIYQKSTLSPPAGI